MGAAVGGRRPAREPLDGEWQGSLLQRGDDRALSSSSQVSRPGYWSKEDTKEEERVSLQELAKPFRVFRDGLQPGTDLQVRLGPVVGKVTDTTAIILLEVGHPGGDVTLSIARALEGRRTDEPGREHPVWAPEPPLPAWELDTVEFAARGSVSVCQVMDANKPYSFFLEGLEPATAYFVFVGGVCKPDLQRRVARFRTLPQRVDALRVLAVVGHQPTHEDLGPEDPWSRLYEMQCEGPEPQIVLHIGSTVHSLPAAQRASREMHEHGSFRIGIRREMERKARDALRSAFVEAWGQHEGFGRALSGVGSHLPAFAPLVDLDQKIKAQGSLLESDSQEERRTLLRLILDVSREYQRALWQPSRGSNHVRVDAGGEYSAAQHHMEFWEEAGPVSDMYAEEWHFHRYGQIVILMLDTKGGYFGSLGLRGKVMAGGEVARRPLLSMRQRDMLSQVLKHNMTQVIILASDMPLFLELRSVADMRRCSQTTPPGSASTAFRDAMSNSTAPELSALEWASHTEELVGVLDSLFEWKNQRFPDREVVMLSASPGFGTTGDVRDHQLGLSIPVVVTGPIHGPTTDPGEFNRQGNLGNGRFSWAFRKPTRRCNFAVVDVDLSCNATGLGKLSLDLELVSMKLPQPTTWGEAVSHV